METFTPSLDWGDELITSVLWVAKAWAFAAMGMVVVLALPGTVHHVGQAVLGITGDYFKGRERSRYGPVGRAALVGDDRRPSGRAVQLSVERQFSALQAAFEGEGDAKDIAIKAFGSPS